MSTVDIADVTTKVYQLLKPLQSEERDRVLRAARALLGDTQIAEPSAPPRKSMGESTGSYPIQVERWMSQNSISREHLEQVFDINDGQVDIIVGAVIGETKKQQTINCYLLVGLKEFFRSGSAKFADADAIELCQRMGCYDRSNHATHRKSFGNQISGSREDGYTLPAPGLKAAAELVRRSGTSG